MAVSIEKLRQGWLDEGLSPTEIELLTKIYYDNSGDGAEDAKDAMDADISDKGEDEQAPPSDSESDPPMSPEPGPEDPEDDKYNPERNVDEEGGGVGKDPMCKPIFEPSVARMKRGKTYDMWIPGGPDGYEGRRTQRSNSVKIELKLGAPKSANMKKFQGRADIRISAGAPTPLFMPSVETNVSEYSCNDGSEVYFWKNGADMVYVQARSGGERPVTLNYTVWCEMEPKINNLLYYYQDYDDSLTLYDMSMSDANFKDSLDGTFRRNVPVILEIINKDYFADMITVLKDMPIPGMPMEEGAKKALEDVRKRYNFKRTMAVLAGYCMSFGCGDIPEGDMAIACTRSREGACRNRSVVFFVVAMTLGIPTRYCCSDCHAYVEVYFPNVKRWVGLDLGGCPPPQPKGPDGKPPKKPTPDEAMAKFKDMLIGMGWKESEARFKIAMDGAQEHIRQGGM